MSDAAFLHDADGRLVFVNKAYEDLSGLGSDELIGKFYWEHFPKMSGPFPGHGGDSAESANSEIRSEFSNGSKTYASLGNTPTP